MKITLPLKKDTIKSLRAGDILTITGYIYTGRDAAHKRMCESIEKGIDLPFDIKDEIIYYVGPCPKKDGEVIGSCGPTTSGRMDAYAPKLIKLGLSGMIGKGIRSDEVIETMKKHSAIYFGAIGGAGALIAKHVKSMEVVAYEDLGTEAIHRLYVEDFPVTVVIDSQGNNLYELGKNKYKNCYN